MKHGIKERKENNKYGKLDQTHAKQYKQNFQDTLSKTKYSEFVFIIKEIQMKTRGHPTIPFVLNLINQS